MPAALAAALGDVVARHESLRTVFPVDGGQPYQHIIPAGEATVPVTVTAARPGELAGLIDAAARHEFDLASELPVRAWLFTLARAGACAGAAVPSHRQRRLVDAGADGGPGRGVPARRDGRAPGWAPLPVQYADYALWQRDLLGGDGDARRRGAGRAGASTGGRRWPGCPRSWSCRSTGRARRSRPGAAAQVRWQLADAGLHAALAGAGP